MSILNQTTKRTAIAAAVAATLGTVAPIEQASADLIFNWTGYFRMLDPAGAALANSSISAKSNQFETPISGTLTYDTVAGTGTMTIGSFLFFNAPQPAVASGITFQEAGGNLLLGNMVFDWGGNNGIPVSIVWDASGLQSAIGGGLTVGDTINGTAAGSVRGAADGVYVGGSGTHITSGYLDLGVLPVATLKWNTTPTCTPGGGNAGACMTVNPSGSLPLVADPVGNNNDYVPAFMGGTPVQFDPGIGGSPMLAGPFENYSANFDIVSLVFQQDTSVAPSFTTPSDLSPTIAEAATPTSTALDIGTVADEPGGSTVEYRVYVNGTPGAWLPDSGGVNNVTFNLTETVNSFEVEWRVTAGANVALSSPNQSVVITIADATDPAFTSLPADISVTVASTADTVTFEGSTSSAGAITATDATDPNPLIEWSLDNLNWTADTAGTNESSNGFGAGANTVYWRVTDATGNVATYQQTVTLDLPTGIVGQPCVVDPDLLNATIGDRLMEGKFTMRDSTGALVGTVDNAVTGTMNTAAVCADTSCTTSGAALSSPTPFYGNLWTTSTIRIFNQPGTYTFETCPGDGSTQCTAPRPLSMTVGTGQIGAHMLFFWNNNNNIDVALVWDLSCGGSQLVSTDPDGDGIIGTPMVDGPFQGFNAAFDISARAGQQPITTGGYSVNIPVVKNSVPNTSPIALSAGTIGSTLGGVTITKSELMSTYGAASDGGVVDSCVGGCFDFSVGGLAPGATIQVVLPLSQPIPWYSLYRKYDAASDSWKAFVVNGTDNVMTAPLNSAGRCPEPGAGDYSTNSSGVLPNMLRAGDQCVQLTITDGGPNDSDPAAGVIADPSGVGLTSGPSAPRADTSGGGGCTIAGDAKPQQRADWLVLGGLLALLGVARRKFMRH